MEGLGNQVHHTIQKLLPNHDAVLKGENSTIHMTGTVQSWFEEHESELQHLPWPPESPQSNITKQFWSVLEPGLRNRFHLKRLSGILNIFFKRNGIQFYIIHYSVHSKYD
jgi:hypothetical protein